MQISIFTTTQRVLVISFLGFCLAIMGRVLPAYAQDTVNPQGSPNAFVQAVGNNALNAVRGDAAAKRGDLRRINELVNQYLLPYVNFEKTTQLAAGQYWRTATAQQKKDLAQAFKGTLIRTYGGALNDVDKIAALNILPFRGDASANDALVRSTFLQRNGPSIGVDYRLEKTSDGWKIYDLNVEGIWLIQNYRNQFSQQISQNGIDGLIAALNQKNK
ncbi:MAG: ABC transporter substrate-binding protein [Burkholderiaceae bacterium]